MKRKVVNWFIFKNGRAHTAKFIKRKIFSGGDVWDFGTQGGSLIAEMSDGVFEYRHTYKFNFQDIAGDEIIDKIKALDRNY